MKYATIAVLAMGLPDLAQAVTCRDVPFEDQSYTVCEVQADEDLRLFTSGPDGPYANFAALEEVLNRDGSSLAFAMNAGMFDEDLAPIGLYVESGVEQQRLVTRDGPGNFGLLPNGVFCATLAGDSGPRFQVIETRKFADDPPACWMATQSGPMLVIDGQLHPKFVKSSDSLKYRNGVATDASGSTAVFAISNDAVNFDSFARLFRDELGLDQALFLDGSISRLHAPMLGRSDMGFPIGPILAVVEPKE